MMPTTLGWSSLGPTAGPVRPETELLLLSARPVATVDGARARELLAGQLDWAFLLWSGLRQGMLPALSRLVESIGNVAGPVAQLGAYRAARARQNALAMRELASVLTELAAAGVAALPLRSALLADELGHAADEREPEPPDLLVVPGDVERARAALIGRGYAPLQPLGQRAEAAVRRTRGVALQHSEHAVRVHLLEHVAPSYFMVGLSAEAIWQRRRALRIAGHTVGGPAPEDLLLASCLHGAVNLWDGLARIRDLARLIESATIDWITVAARAREARAERAVLLGLMLAADLLDAPVSPTLRQRAEADADVCLLAALVLRRLVDGGSARTGELARARFRLRARERLVDRLRYGVTFALTPDLDDLNAVDLPDRLFPFYHLVRPARLIGVLARAALRAPARAPYYPSPMPLVERMLELARVGPSDVVYDLGCGDGRIVIAAAQRYGARAVGIDLDPARVSEARANAARAGVDGRVTFVEGDALAVDLRPASVVTLWTVPALNLQLRPRLRAELAPGARVVGHSFDMGSWVPDQTELVVDGDEVGVVYVWRIGPER